ncbi:MAG TPA: DegT/DnrJ/EryC1/StrS family aminotransferase [Longimicrobium sp.]|nr:DegT/DnrJ/EryC1/StrS family aminotransferase [Longimicrobium sp.]
MPGPGWYFFGDEERRQVDDVLRSRELSRYRFDQTDDDEPSKVFQFERTMEAYLGAPHCLATNSCTSALLAALTALGVGPGDEVIVPGYTFIASIAAIVYARAVPVLAEVDDSLTLDPDDVRRKITPRTRAILCVHMLGAPCDMDALEAIAREHGLFLVEDVAQACGGEYRGRRLGSIGDAGAFSLNVFKTITAGDGGCLAVRDDAVFERAFAFHDHGFKPFRLGVADAQGLMGLNLRMAELVGAVALAQARKLPAVVEAVRAQKRRLLDALGPLGVPRRRLNDPDGECGTLLVLLLDSAEQARRVAAALGVCTLVESGRHYYGAMPQLLNRRIPSQAGCPFFCEAHPTDREYTRGMLPRTDDLLSRSVALSVGVVDSYLGAGFGVNVLSPPEEVDEVARIFHERTADAFRAGAAFSMAAP